MDNLTTSTELGIGSDLLQKIQNTKFCIVGCGGIGAFFAEILVRTGGIDISLIDADNIEYKNLNRTPFLNTDIGKPKVIALKQRLESINDSVNIKAFNKSFGHRNKDDKDRTEIRDLIANSDIVIIVIDKNEIRIECETLCKDTNRQYLVIGVEINYSNLFARYACGWKTTTDSNEKDLEGYGENNGSYMSICMEAVASGFNLMLHHMQNKDSEHTSTMQEYKNYQPIALKTNNSKF